MAVVMAPVSWVTDTHMGNLVELLAPNFHLAAGFWGNEPAEMNSLSPLINKYIVFTLLKNFQVTVSQLQLAFYKAGQRM